MTPVPEEISNMKPEDYRPAPFIVQAAKTGNLSIFKKIESKLESRDAINETGFVSMNKKKA